MYATAIETHLAHGYKNHFRHAFVLLRLRLVVQEADEIGDRGADVVRHLARLLLLLPLDDVADGKHAGVALDLERWVYSDGAGLGQDARVQSVEDRGVGLCAKSLNLMVE